MISKTKMKNFLNSTGCYRTSRDLDMLRHPLDCLSLQQHVHMQTHTYNEYLRVSPREAVSHTHTHSLTHPWGTQRVRNGIEVSRHVAAAIRNPPQLWCTTALRTRGLGEVSESQTLQATALPPPGKEWEVCCSSSRLGRGSENPGTSSRKIFRYSSSGMKPVHMQTHTYNKYL